VLLKDCLIENKVPFKEDKGGFIHVFAKAIPGRGSSSVGLAYLEGVDYTLLRSVEMFFDCSGRKVPEIRSPNLKYVTEVNLPNLEYVKGYLDCSKALKINLPNLKYVRGGFDCSSATEINLPNLKYVGGNFRCRLSTKIDFPNLKYVGKYFRYNRLTPKISLPNLKYMDGLV